MKQCRGAFQITRKNMELGQIDQVMLTRMEAMIVNYIAVNYYEMGKREEAIAILEKAKVGYENRYQYQIRLCEAGYLQVRRQNSANLYYKTKIPLKNKKYGNSCDHFFIGESSCLNILNLIDSAYHRIRKVYTKTGTKLVPVLV